MPCAKPKVSGIHQHRALTAPSLHGHQFGAARDDQILQARHDRGRRHVDAGDAGAAKPVERDATGAHVIPRIQGRHPAEVAALLGHLCAGAPDDVVDIAGIDPGPIGERAQYCGAQLLRMDTR